MVKTLTKHGNSYALIIDRAVLDLLKITPETPLEVSTDGRTLTITPVADPQRRARLNAALEKTNRRYGRALKKLAE
ncbi:MAG: AbrB/MazE/SpoVT family DNA-binding domain-containing protein [Phycisphaerae bacterium]